MACLRKSTPHGRVGTVACDEEDCVFRRESSNGRYWSPPPPPEADCVLQSRLRAGDLEDSSARRLKRNDAASPDAEGARDDEVVGKVLNVTEDEHGVTATIRLAPGWTVERIEEGLKHVFWGGPDDYDLNEVAPLNID